MATLGDSCTDRPGDGIGNGYTVIFTKYQFTNPANISSWCCYVSLNPSNAKLKVFRDDGTNWIFVGESSLQSVVVGLNSGLSANINVQYGDYIAFYIETGSGIEREGTLYSIPVKVGDISSNSLKSSWDVGSGEYISFQVTYTLNGLDNAYINSSTGSDTNAGDSCAAGHPVQTFGAAYGLLNSGGTIHICNSGADFSGETVTLNKSFSITVDGDGNFYMPQAS